MGKEQKSVIETRKKLIARLRKRKPEFRRALAFAYSMKEGWRKPRGIHSKMREDEKSKPATVKTGYRTAKIVRGLHPSGYEEFYVPNIKQLQKIDAKTQAARLASGISEKKRKMIVAKANELGIKVLNP